MTIETYLAVNWLKEAAVNRPQGEYTVVVPTRNIILNNGVLEKGQWYVIPEDQSKRLKAMPEVNKVLIKDIRLTQFIEFLIQKGWKGITKAEMEDHKIFNDMAGNWGLYEDPFINTSGQIDESLTIVAMRATTGAVTDFRTGVSPSFLTAHEIIKTLCAKLENYQDKDFIDLTELFGELKVKQGNWIAATDFLKAHKNEAVLYVALLLTITMLFGGLQYFELDSQKKGFNMYEAIASGLAIMLSARIHQKYGDQIRNGYERVSAMPQRFFANSAETPLKIDFTLADLQQKSDSLMLKKLQ